MPTSSDLVLPHPPVEASSSTACLSSAPLTCLAGKRRALKAALPSSSFSSYFRTRAKHLGCLCCVGMGAWVVTEIPYLGLRHGTQLVPSLQNHQAGSTHQRACVLSPFLFPHRLSGSHPRPPGCSVWGQGAFQYVGASLFFLPR